MPSFRPALVSRLRRLVLAALAVAGCRDSSAPDPAARAATVVVQLETWVDPTSRVIGVTLELGDSTRLAARAFDAEGHRLETISAAWSSSAPDVVDVSDGLVRGRRPGRATVRATVGSSSDSAIVTVVGPAARLSFEHPTLGTPPPFDDTLRVQADANAFLRAAVLDAAGNRLQVWVADQALRWGLLDSTRATVGVLGNGIARVAASRLGHTRIVATAFGFADTAEVIVRLVSGRSLPLLVAETLRFRSVAVGSLTACGLSTEERLYCWGTGYLGTGRYAYDTAGVPRQIAPSSLRFSSVAVGGTHHCALDPRGEAYCWGDARFGQTGTLVEFPYAPTPVADGRLYARITVGGAHTCAIDGEGALFCWGWDASGALGVAAQAPLDCREWDSVQNRYVQLSCRIRPTRADAPVKFVEVAAGGTHTCARSDAGEIWCWGSGAGAGTAAGSRVPVRLSGIAGAVAIEAGTSHSCAVLTDGSAWCWGENGDGQLGDGSITSRAIPRPVAGEDRFRSVAAGSYSTCGATQAGRVRCWGSNTGTSLAQLPDASVGSLGSDELSPRLLTPTLVLEPVTAIEDVSVGSGVACARRPEGLLFCWGVAGQMLGTAGATRVTP